MLKVHVVPCLNDNYAYVLEGSNQRAAVIDAGEAGPVVRFLKERGLTLELCLCTHHHADHVGGVLDLKGEVWASALDKGRIAGVSRFLEDGETTSVLGEEMKVILVPGHTAGQISFYFPKMNVLFTGDTLFSLGCGRLFEGSPKQMMESLGRIKTLPEETLIYFGHEYTAKNAEFAQSVCPSEALTKYQASVAFRREAGAFTTPTKLSVELEINPFLNTDDLAEWTRRRAARNSF